MNRKTQMRWVMHPQPADDLDARAQEAPNVGSILVRAERLQDIPAEDAIAEGHSCIKDFALFWDAIYEKQGYSWDSNPWVWVLNFEQTSART